MIGTLILMFIPSLFHVVKAQIPGQSMLYDYDPRGNMYFRHVVPNKRSDEVTPSNINALASVYPNPANEYVVVELEADAVDSLDQFFTLYTSDGRIVNEFVIQANQQRAMLTTSGLPNGLYFIVPQTNKSRLEEPFNFIIIR